MTHSVIARSTTKGCVELKIDVGIQAVIASSKTFSVNVDMTRFPT
jgi:hypothetical protein